MMLKRTLAELYIDKRALFMEEMRALESIVDEVLATHNPSVFQLSADQLLLMYSSAYHLYGHGKYIDSKRLFRFLTICEPFDRRYWMGLAASLLQIKDYKGSLECYSVAAIQDPDDPYVHLYAADCLFALKKVKEGIRTLESAIAAAKKSDLHLTLLKQLENMHHAWIKKAAQV